MNLQSILTILLVLVTINLSAQDVRTMEQIKLDQEGTISQMADLQAQLNALEGVLDTYDNELDQLDGWQKGLNGLIGFNFNRAFGWVANPSPRASTTAFSLNLTAFANYSKDKFFFNNRAIVTESWQDVDLSDADREQEGDGLFNNGIVDIFNISSLAGYKITETFALSGLVEFNTSIGNFINPGTFDVGIGGTWIPTKNFTLTVLPINFHVAFSGITGLSNDFALGAKLRADYFNEFRVYGRDLTWSSTLTAFLPYTSADEQFVFFDPRDLTLAMNDETGFSAGLFEYTWLNTLSFELWQGLGIGIGWGLRKSDFEGEKLSQSQQQEIECDDCLLSGPRTQSYFNIGLSYAF